MAKKTRKKFKQKQSRFEKHEGRCPACKAEIHKQAYLCVSCGRDRRRRGAVYRFLKAPLTIVIFAIAIPAIGYVFVSGLGLLWVTLVSNTQIEKGNIGGPIMFDMSSWKEDAELYGTREITEELKFTVPMRLRFLALNFGWGPVVINDVIISVIPDKPFEEFGFSMKSADIESPIIIKPGTTEFVEIEYAFELELEDIVEAFKKKLVFATTDKYMLLEMDIVTTAYFQIPMLSQAWFSNIENNQELRTVNVFFKPSSLGLTDSVLDGLPLHKPGEVTITEHKKWWWD